MKIYGIFSYYMSVPDFQDFINPENQIGMLLQAHLIAIQTILDPILSREQGPTPSPPNSPSKHKHSSSVAWLDSIHSKVREELRPWFAWPMRRAEELRAMIEENRMAMEMASLDVQQSSILI